MGTVERVIDALRKLPPERQAEVADFAEFLKDRLPLEGEPITDGDEPMARVTRQGPAQGRMRKPGSAKGKLRIVVEDDEHLAGFADYLP